MPSPVLPFKGLPLSGSGSPSLHSGVGPPRAQNLSVAKLQPKIAREQAAVSMSQVLSRKAGMENTRSTSIAHIGQTSTGPTTSITHPESAVRSVQDMSTAGQADQGADNRRYAYMRKLIKERQAKEAVEAKKAAVAQKGGLDLGKGAAFKKSGVGGVHKQLGKEFREHRTAYSSLSGTEKQILEEAISGRLANKSTGSGISRYDKKAMKKDISQARDSGDVSFGHAKILKKVVDKLN